MNSAVRNTFVNTAADESWRIHVEEQIGMLFQHHETLQLDLEKKVQAGLVAGVREVIKDDELMQQLSAKLSTNLFVHGGQQASQWIGNRILTAAVIAITGFGVAWLVRNGKI